MKNLTFSLLHNSRKNFMSINKQLDHVILEGKNNILLSAPHGVSQVRLGLYKYNEIGSITTALYLSKSTNSFLIAKTRNNNDDANFDKVSLYKDSISNLIENKNIKYLIDFHGLSAKKDCDVNLGIHLGKNIETNIEIFNVLNKMLEEKGFKVNIDNPFMANSNTISSSMKNKYPFIWSLQIEINCSITNKKENFVKYNILLEILESWLLQIAKK